MKGLGRRLAAIEREIGDQEFADAPCSVIEFLHGFRDEAARRRMGPEGRRESAKVVVELFARVGSE